MRATLLFFILIANLAATSQEIIYSVPHREDNVDINFEIIGKVSGNFMVFKNSGNRHTLQVFNNNMVELRNDRLNFLSDRTLQVNFIAYPDFFYMIYQTQKGNILFCYYAQFNGAGEKMGDPVLLDTTKVGVFSENKIYSTAYSEDKNYILISKSRTDNNEVSYVTKRYSRTMQLIDSAKQIFRYNRRHDTYTDLQIDNKGTIIFAKEKMKGAREMINEASLIILPLGASQTLFTALNLNEKYIDELKIKIDNLNQDYILNSLYFTRISGNVEGLYSARLNDQLTETKASFIPFPDSVRAKFSNARYRSAFDDMFLRNMFLKKDGSFLVIGEDFSSQTSGSRWDRWDYMYGSPYPYDYYWYRPGYYNYYSPYRNYSRNVNTHFMYDNILIMDIDSNLLPRWTKLIFKNQSDDNNDSYLSYSTLNTGTEILFLFIEKGKNTQVVTCQGLSPDGSINRYATLKSREKGFQFMPRLAKQTGLKEIVMPVVYRSMISFAKVDFSKPAN